ncbi:MAG: ABC transporter, partial [Mycobacteriaceae bacterium]
GQRQRVGVARALAADPPIMLMDEPFGAVDPIVREHLQNEVLRLQQNIGKTIVFVTHDIAEAVKMGDRIAIVSGRSAVAQFDVPARILANPANDFVRDFLGSNAELRSLSLLCVSPQMFSSFAQVSVEPGTVDSTTVHRGPATVVLESGRPTGWLIPDQGQGCFIPVRPLVLGPHTTLSDALNQMVTAGSPAALLADRAGQFAGCLDFSAVQRAVAVAAAGGIGVDGRPTETEAARAASTV